jgi:endonuclease/exonuclease/phosphatase family metal-dependent hydrolase
MRIISWNIRAFVSCVQNQTNAFRALQAILDTFDLIVIYEVPNSANGNTELTNLVTSLNLLHPPAVPPTYQSFSEPTGGIGNENDQIAVIWNLTTVAVVNTTAARQGGLFAGRAPIYFDVTELANGNTCEFCAWHAPSPGGNDAIIAQGWQNILQDSQDHNRNPLTSIIMGDFNSNFANPATGTKRKPGNFLRKQITGGSGTTLRPAMMASPVNTEDYRTTNLYDQFYVDTATVTVNRVGIYDVLDRLANNLAPLTGLFPGQYNTARKAYNFYYPSLSDHLPVGLDVTL